MVELAFMSVGVMLILVIFAFYSIQAPVTSTENRLKDRLIVRVRNTVHEALLFSVSMILCLFSLLDCQRHHQS